MLEKTFNVVLWDLREKKMKSFEFIITVDPSKLPAAVLHKTMSNKTGKTKMGGGAITIERSRKEHRYE